MKVYVVTEVAKPFYYAPIEKLKQDGKIQDWELWSFRTFRPLIKNVPLKIIRFFKPDFARNREFEPITLVDFFSRLVLPIRMLFWDNIIFGMEPFDAKVIFPLLLKLLGKNVIEYTSWPYWEGNFQPRTGVPGVRVLWRLFLKNLKVIAVSPAAEEAVKEFAPTARVTQIPHSVDLDKFFPEKTKKNKRPKIVSLIQLYPEKGINQLIELAHRMPEADFEIISRGGTAEPEVRKAEKELKNFSWVSDKGREKKLRQADIFVLASYKTEVPYRWEELFGMAIVEAMASGIPAIVTDQIGPRGIVEDGKTGFVVAQKDADEIE
ncbi:MAG TPA: glycosyltransferase, partial [candidate division WWE3 bacterium]|nr:glycosyltransferase [candidate division WWE3 bacterium]